MPTCPFCGKSLAEVSSFCPHCGERLSNDALSDSEGRTPKWVGFIQKCPQCGETIDSFVGNCPACGYEFRGVSAVSSAKELSERLNEIEAKRPRKERILFANSSISSTDAQKISLIKSYPIPNAKEDLFEFIILAMTNSQVKLTEYGEDASTLRDRALREAWESKFNQAWTKAEMLFGDSPELIRLKGMRNDMQEEHELEQIKGKKKSRKLWLGIAALWIVLLVGVGGIFACDGMMIQRENDRLQQIVYEVNDLIAEGEYSLARARASEIVFSGSTTKAGDQAAEKWDAVRREVMSSISEAEAQSEDEA